MQEKGYGKLTNLVACLVIVVGSLLGEVPSAQAADQVKFAPPVDYSVANTPVPLAVGDVTGEGTPDLVAANNFSDSVSVLRNNGNGTFAPAVDYPVGAGPSSVTLGDFDKDGDLDVATANSRSNNVSVLLNKGVGTFVAPVNYPVTNAGAISAGDVNKDGAPDLVVTTGSFDVSGNNTVAVFLNNGNGTFAPAVYYAIGVTGPHGVTIGDVDKDGSLDVVVSNRDHNTIFVLRNNGNGTFAAAVSFPAVDAPNTVITADVDRDGDLDLVTGNFFNSVAILRNNGNGAFAPPETYVIGGEIVGVAAGDIDNDGHLDVVAANFTPLVSDDKPVAVLLNNGNGTFALTGNFGAVGQHAVSVIVADLDEDGKLDVATANPPSNTVSVLLNQTSTAGLLDHLVTFVPLASTYRTTSDTTGCPSGFVGKFSFDARLANRNGSPPISDLVVQVKTLTNGNVLHNADGGNGGIGSTLTVVPKNGYSDGNLSPGEFVDVNFTICLKERKPFKFFVDVLGTR